MITYLMLPLVWLIAAHFFFDFPGQGPFLSAAKNPHTSVEGYPWYHAMTAHVFMHAAAVATITHSIFLGLIEFIIHFVTDIYKCNKRISFVTDQTIHLICKVGYWIYGLSLAYPQYSLSRAFFQS